MSPTKFSGQDLIDATGIIGTSVTGRAHRHPRQWLVGASGSWPGSTPQLDGSRHYLVVRQFVDQVVKVVAINAHADSLGEDSHLACLLAGAEVGPARQPSWSVGGTAFRSRRVGCVLR